LVEIFATRDEPDTIDRLFAERGERKRVFYCTMRDGSRVCAAAATFNCGPVELKVPAQPVKPGQVFGDLMFPDVDSRGSGRPVRMLLIRSKELPPQLWELGGYTLSKLRATASGVIVEPIA
jgi:hypothetical protein